MENINQIHLMNNYFGHKPDNKEAEFWINHYAKKYRDLCNKWYNEEKVKKELYIKN